VRRIALLSLLHDKGKLVASLAGVAFAATLVLCQLGLYVGFLRASAALIEHVGGDVWVMARGIRVLDNGEPLSAGSRSIVSSHPCVQSVRGVVMSFSIARRATGGRDAVQVIAAEPGGPSVLPWNLRHGLPHDLDAPMRVAIDAGDLDKLELPRDPLGQNLEVNGRTVWVQGVTEGIKGFTLSPYVFARVRDAQRLVGIADGQFHYWVVDLEDRACTAAFTASVERHHDLQAKTREDFVRMTEDYWVVGSGAGTALGFSALLGLVVGTVIVAQTLFSMTKEHEKELAMLKAMGASAGELAGFVLWQAAFLAVFGGLVGLGVSVGLKRLILELGLTVVLSPGVLATGAGSIVLMCGLASLGSVRKVVRLQAAEVFA
jgi:putative ABC transport system permease protein